MLFVSTILSIGLCALGCGCIFGSYLLSISRAPEQQDILFTQAMTTFVFVESFAFLNVMIAVLVTTMA